MRGEVMNLHVPGVTGSLGIVRTSCVAAAAPAIRDYDRLHDLRLAVEELAVVLVEHGADDARLGVRVMVEDHAVEVEAFIAADPALDDTPAPSEVARMVISAIVDDWEITWSARTITARMTMGTVTDD